MYLTPGMEKKGIKEHISAFRPIAARHNTKTLENESSFVKRSFSGRTPTFQEKGKR